MQHKHGNIQRALTVGGSITVQLVSSLTRLDLNQKENMLFIVYSKSAESKLVKPETSRALILLPMVSFFWQALVQFLNFEEIWGKSFITFTTEVLVSRIS